MLYYAGPSLEGVLPEKYFEQFMLLVFSATIFLKADISDAEFHAASVAIERFLLSTLTLYNKSFITFKLHLMLHVPRFVLLRGQLWDTSYFTNSHKNSYSLRREFIRNLATT